MPNDAMELPDPPLNPFMEGHFPLVALAQCPPKQMNLGLFEDEAGYIHYGNTRPA